MNLSGAAMLKAAGLILLAVALGVWLAGCASACPETAERERLDHGKYVLWCAR